MRNEKKPSLAKELMNKYDFKMAKSLGQNFLVNEMILKEIVESADLDENDFVLEIGPGIGTMTQALGKQVKKVVAVEIDKRLIPILNVALFGYDNISVVNEDILKVDLPKLLLDNFGDQKAKVVANLPYYITTPIIMMLLEDKLNLKSITIMIQKEVAERITASPGGKVYGALSVAVQYYAKTHLMMIVPPDAFVPQPGVDSAVIRIDILDKPSVEVKNEKLFFDVVKAGFSQRRKMLLNTLTSSNLNFTKEQIREILAECGIDEKRRAETLSLQEFGKIADKIYDIKIK